MIAKKSLGQHFLRCAWVVNTLITAAKLTKKDTVLEIGPGTGILTRPLAAASSEVIAVEKDERLADSLAGALAHEQIRNVRIIKGDFLQLTQTKFGSVRAPYKVVANIPYYLTGRLIRLLLGSPVKPSVIALTVQKEVAERMIAKPPRMNLLALAVQAYGTPKIIKIVPASCFSPKPKIDSAIIIISDISDDFFTKNAIGQNAFFALARAAFGHKRKILVNTLPIGGSHTDPNLVWVSGNKIKIAKKLAVLGISPRARPEELSLHNWAAVVKLFS